MPRSGSSTASGPHQKALYALGVAFAAYGTAVLPPEGNGFIAVFVAAIALGIRRPDIRECFEARSEDMIEVVKLGVFLVFGAILTFDGLFTDGWAAVGDRRLHAAPGAPGRRVRRAGRQPGRGYRGKAFMSWFGPKGVATMTFALFVLASEAAGGRTDRQHGGADGVRVGDRARADRPAGRGVDGAAERALAQRARTA